MASVKAVQQGVRGWIQSWFQSVRPVPMWFLVLAIVMYMVVNYLGDVSLDPAWHGRVVKKISNTVTGQMLGNALYEEVFWRAFVISQLVLVLAYRMRWTFGKALTWAIILSTILFAVSHLPHDFAYDYTTQEILIGQVGRSLAGLLFAGIFLLSRNLFLVIGIHSLGNVPLGLFEGSEDPTSVFILLAPLLVLVILAIRRRKAAR